MCLNMLHYKFKIESVHLSKIIHFGFDGQWFEGLVLFHRSDHLPFIILLHQQGYWSHHYAIYQVGTSAERGNELNRPAARNYEVVHR